MTTYSDLAEWALARLADTPAVTALVMAVDGAAQIREVGDVTAEMLTEAQTARRELGMTDRVLAIVVRDGGEDGRVERSAHLSVYIYDRYGYANIRTAREAVISALVNQPVTLVRDALVSEVLYSQRSGHEIDTQFDLDIEQIDFIGPLIVEAGCYA